MFGEDSYLLINAACVVGDKGKVLNSGAVKGVKVGSGFVGFGLILMTSVIVSRHLSGQSCLQYQRFIFVDIL